MIVGRVVGRIVSTRKHERLVGNKFLVCEVKQKGVIDTVVAVDTVGAGIGENVLIVQGSGARASMTSQDSPVDASIVGIVDEENDLSIFE